MPSLSFSRFFVFSSVFALTSCASYIEGGVQQVTFETPGVADARCDIEVGANGLRYTVYPPETAWIDKTAKDMHITCQAPGNRITTMDVKSELAGTTLLNVANGTLGAFYDGERGAMFKFPDVVSIDFSNVVAAEVPLPAYENAGSLQNVVPDKSEYYGPKTNSMPSDNANDARYRAAYADAAVADAAAAAHDAERENRINALEGGFYGDKGKSPVSSARTAEPATPSVVTDPTAIPSSNGSPLQKEPQLSEPLFPSTTSF